jgi:hypothetical protein
MSRDATAEVQRLQEQRWRWMNYRPQTAWEEGAVAEKVAELDRRLRDHGIDPGQPYV